MPRALAALVLALAVLAPRSVAAACPNPLKPYCVYLPASRVEKPGGCERVTGDAFDDATAWKLDKPAAGKGSVTLSPEAAFSGQLGAVIDPQDARESFSRKRVGLSSVAAARRIGGIWLTFMVRRAIGSADPSWDDVIGAHMFAQGSAFQNWWSGNWSMKAEGAPEDWVKMTLSMDDSADGARADLVSIRIWATGKVAWHVDDVELWQCPKGQKP